MQAALEVLPTLVFVGSYFFFEADLIWATGYTMMTAFIGLIIIFIIHRKWSRVQIASFFSFMVFGGLTIILHKEDYIKMKATFVYIFLAAGIWVSLYKNVPILKVLVGDRFDLDDAYWAKLCHRFANYFVFMALLNEIIWRNFSTDFWVGFKLIGGVLVFMLFIGLQIWLVTRYIAGRDKPAND